MRVSTASPLRAAFTAGAAAIAIAMSACSPQPAPPKADGAAPPPGVASGDGFYSEFRAANQDKTTGTKAASPEFMDGKMYRSGQSVRMEFADPEKGNVVIISTPAHTIMIGTENGKQSAIKLPGQDFARTLGVELPDFTKPDWMATEKGQLVGPCSAMGQSGQLYRITEQAETSEACVSQQGWPLEVKQGGKVVWQTVKYTPGAQDAALFAVPAGIEVVDMDAMMKGFGAEMEKMMKEAGKAPPAQK